MILSLKTEQDITANNIKKLDKLVNNENVILLNYATWCLHCNMFKPEWEKFKIEAAKKKMHIVEIENKALDKLQTNKTLFKKITPKDGMVYFPMLIIFVKKPNGCTKTFYKGNKKSDDLLAFSALRNKHHYY